jgi:hypothetical protein
VFVKVFTILSLSILMATPSLAAEHTTPTSSSARYAYGRDELSDPTMRNRVVDNCKTGAASAETLQKLATFMHVSVSQVKDTYCRRIITAYAEGRIPYDDYVRFNENHVASANIVRAIRGK